jgi:hypothetical protein
MIEASQRMLRINSQVKEGVGIKPAIKRHIELEINTIQMRALTFEPTAKDAF